MRVVLAVCALVLLVPTVGVAQRAAALDIPPLVLVSPEKRPVVLSDATVTVEPAGGMARTTIEMEFRNPGTEVLEGNLQFPLRPGQQVIGFALDVQGRMREAVIVEKEQGRRVFEAIEREGIDPGLLEQTQGEFFRLRIYPFPAGGTRRVTVVLVEPLDVGSGAASITVPLQFAAGLGSIEVQVRSSDAPLVEGALRKVVPRKVHSLWSIDFARAAFNAQTGITLRFPVIPGPRVHAQSHRGQRYFVAEVPVPVEKVARDLPPRVGILWDSSMSGGKRAHDLELALLDRYFVAAGAADVDLIRLRDVAEPVQRFKVAGGDWSTLRQALESTDYDGATRAGGWRPDMQVGEYLLFGDGLFNYGHQPFPMFAEGQTLYTVLAGVSGDSARLAALAHARNGRAITLNGPADLDQASDDLLHSNVRLASVEAVGAADVLAQSPHSRNGRLRFAGRITGAHASLRVRLRASDGYRTLDVPLAEAVESEMAAWVWASYRLASLREAPEVNRKAMLALGRDFGLVTPQSSLLVLERAEDYVRYAIDPPAQLLDEVAALQREKTGVEEVERAEHTEQVARAWQERIEWWEKPFPKDQPSAAEPAEVATELAAMPLQAAPVVSPAPPPMSLTTEQETLDRVEVTGARLRRADIEGTESLDAGALGATIALQPWRSDSAVANRLRLAAPDTLYALYLDERTGAGQGTAFYLDVADILFEKKKPDLALRVLSNLAEMQLENRHVLRVLAYRLMQAGRADLALPVLEQVLAVGGEEPQSYRDLALAHAAIGNRQQAVDLLHEVASRPWDARFAGLETIALAELNALVATSPAPLDTSRIPAQFLCNLPLGLRTVLSWDSDNSDMDLWVMDPNGEKAFYSNPLTYQGGRMSEDFTGGYGPEEFALRKPKPGTYIVKAHLYGETQQIVAGATTLHLWLSTGFGTARQKDERVVLRLDKENDEVFVGEFKVD